ncbi:DUF6221 family protein [Nonomuraea sp. CA-143628]|uniref:DUF6221 family protein n=1 Tax=Nonomuraea sp. CA-143628 TaxID=3239997 RepID=UPI003D8F6A99
MSRLYDELGSRDPGTATPSFDVQQARDMVAWLENHLLDNKVIAERAGGDPAIWHLDETAGRQFVNLVRRRPGSGIDHVVTWGTTGAMSYPDATHAARHHPRHELAVNDYHRALLALHAIQVEKIHRYDDDGGRHLVPFATCTYCDTGNPYEAPHMGYPCPTIRGLLRAHRDLPGYLPEWTEQ